jgi:preprotein translocase subunit SecB
MTENVIPDTPGAYILEHYLADFSIENLAGRLPAEQAAELALGMEASVYAAPLPEAAPGMHGVQITLGLPAQQGERIIFLIEMRYRVNVRVQGVSPENIPALLQVQVPSAVFPAIKEIVERNGAFAGYPELVLLPIDFAALFHVQSQA